MTDSLKILSLFSGIGGFDFSLDKDFGYCCFAPLTEILAGASKVRCFESSSDAKEAIDQIIKFDLVENRDVGSYSVEDSTSIEMPELPFNGEKAPTIAVSGKVFIRSLAPR